MQPGTPRHSVRPATPESGPAIPRPPPRDPRVRQAPEPGAQRPGPAPPQERPIRARIPASPAPEASSQSAKPGEPRPRRRPRYWLQRAGPRPARWRGAPAHLGQGTWCHPPGLRARGRGFPRRRRIRGGFCCYTYALSYLQVSTVVI